MRFYNGMKIKLLAGLVGEMLNLAIILVADLKYSELQASQFEFLVINFLAEGI